MENKKINGLKLAIKALSENTVECNWEKVSSCNCGVVSQAVLSLSIVNVERSVKYLEGSTKFN